MVTKQDKTMTNFRIKERDTVTAKATSESGKLLATLYDGGFTRKSQVVSALLSKIPYYSGKFIEVSILNEDTETYKIFRIKTN